MFGYQIMKMTSHPLCYILLVKSKSPCLSHTQREWIPQVNTRGGVMGSRLGSSQSYVTSQAKFHRGQLRQDPQGNSGERLRPRGGCNPGQESQTFILPPPSGPG